MMYNKHLPPVHKLLNLAQQAVFPMTRDEMILIAENSKFPTTVLDFLSLFAPSQTFKSRVDFMTRCEELELLIGQERKMPKEVLRSPQD